jgi:hypothetical protein
MTGWDPRVVAETVQRAWAQAHREVERDAGIVHLDGVPWHEAPAPPRGHRHWAQTSGYLSSLMAIQRCPCGAIRRPGGRWTLLDEPRAAARRPWWCRSKRGD